MMSWELARALARKHGMLELEEDIHWAIERTVEHLQAYPTKQRKRWEDLVRPAAELVDEWLSRGDEYTVDPWEPETVVRFVRSHQVGTVWCVLQAKLRRRALADARLEAVLAQIARTFWVDAWSTWVSEDEVTCPRCDSTMTRETDEMVIGEALRSVSAALRQVWTCDRSGSDPELTSHCDEVVLKPSMQHWGGRDLMDIAPPTPKSAIQFAGVFLLRLAETNECGNVLELTERLLGIAQRDGRKVEDLAHYVVMEALGHGVAYTDDTPDGHGLAVPDAEGQTYCGYEFDGSVSETLTRSSG